MRLEGVAYLPEPGETWETWTVPEELVLTVQFNKQKVIGTAKLFRDRDGVISAVARVPEGAVLLPTHLPDGAVTAPRDVTLGVLAMCPKFALGIHDPEGVEGEVVSISVVEDNANPLIEPYERFDDEGEAGTG